MQMRTDKNTRNTTQERETIRLTDVELDAVVGGVKMQDFHFVKTVDKASATLHTS
jgi:type VI protein secretion system component Hcp